MTYEQFEEKRAIMWKHFYLQENFRQIIVNHYGGIQVGNFTQFSFFG